MKKWLGYSTLAAGLGVVWFAGLMIPPMTRAVVSARWLQSMVILCALSLALSLLLKPWIVGRLEPEGAFLLGGLVPLAGGVLFIWTIWILSLLGIGESGLPRGGIPSLGTFLFVSVGTVFALLLGAFYVVVPLGLLSLYVMRRFAGWLWCSHDRLAI